jgi:hypothetical protein
MDLGTGDPIGFVHLAQAFGVLRRSQAPVRLPAHAALHGHQLQRFHRENLRTDSYH